VRKGKEESYEARGKKVKETYDNSSSMSKNLRVISSASKTHPVTLLIEVGR